MPKKLDPTRPAIANVVLRSDEEFGLYLTFLDKLKNHRDWKKLKRKKMGTDITLLGVAHDDDALGRDGNFAAQLYIRSGLEGHWYTMDKYITKRKEKP